MTLLRRLELLAEQSKSWPDRARIRGQATGPKPHRWRGPTFADKEPRLLAPDDVHGFLHASGEARAAARRELEETNPPQYADAERKAFLKWVAKRHPVRLNKLGRELDWLRGQARAYGISPEEIRWLL